MKYVFRITLILSLSLLFSFTSTEVPEHILYYGKKGKDRQRYRITTISNNPTNEIVIFGQSFKYNVIDVSTGLSAGILF